MAVFHPSSPRTLTKTTNKNKKRKRTRPTSLFQSTASSVPSPMLDRGAATEEEDIDVYNDVYNDVPTYKNVTTPAYITTDAVYMHGCIPEERGNSSPTREPDGIG